MKDIKVSVIIPLYNKEKYIRKCLISVLNQTLKNIEIIIIDDESIDNSYKEIKTLLKEKRIIYKKIINSGVSCARNEGIKLSKGKYLIFIDADDFIEEAMLEKLYDKIEKSKVDLVICGMNEITQANKKKAIKNKNKEVNMELFEYKELLRMNPILLHSCGNKLFKRKLIEQNKIYFFEGSHSYEDYNFVLKYLVFIRKIILLNENYYNYYRNEDSVTKTINKYKNIKEVFLEKKETYDTFQNIEKFLEKNISKVVKEIYIKKMKEYHIYDDGIKSLQDFYIENLFVTCEEVELFSRKIKNNYYNVKIKNKKFKLRFALFKIFRRLLNKIFLLKKKFYKNIQFEKEKQ